MRKGKVGNSDKKADVKELLITISVLICVCALPAISCTGDIPYPNHVGSQNVTKNRECADKGGFGQSISIIPRVYISYVGKNDCWSEIRYVEIPIDFLKLKYAAQAKGDIYTPDIMSYGNLVDFFTWLLESGRYAMPGDALSGILGYVQGSDYTGLYGLFRLFGQSRFRSRMR